MKPVSIIGIILFILAGISAQDLPHSIHFEQQTYYRRFGERDKAFYDSLSGFSRIMPLKLRSDCSLQKIVFGFHPYWAGSDYLNYQWNLLSDLCYFAYEVDPSTGDPVTYHDWLTDPAIDSAKANGVKVHLCATIFSGHTVFFSSLSARQNLIDHLISLAEQRDADGVNMDIEAVPSYLRDSITSFMRDLSFELKQAIPDAKVSIDLPAVDWGPSFDISGLDQYIDYFFVMGYDYYWNGSSEAGPVSPLYSLTPGYDYSISKTISAYESDGIDPGKFILGIPYYGRQWKTESDDIPSHKLANGTALTYANIRNNTSTYKPSDYYWEGNSFSSCYIFFQNDNWNQCFIGLDRDLRKKYDIVNYRDLAGIGIWALGYDNGYPDLWQAISDKFSNCFIPLTYDTLYDSGGPAWNYYNGEDYIMTVDQGFSDKRWLSFINLNLEQGYDSLWLYAGRDTSAAFLGAFSGNSNPGNFSSPDGAFTLRFKSDGLQNANGWMAVFHNGSYGMDDNKQVEKDSFTIFPNPTGDYVNILLQSDQEYQWLFICDFAGRVLYSQDVTGNDPPHNTIHVDISTLPEGIFSCTILSKSGRHNTSHFVKLNR